jgi:hypothetical protein
MVPGGQTDRSSLLAAATPGAVGAASPVTCKPARNIDHLLKAAGVVIQCVAVPTGVQRWRLTCWPILDHFIRCPIPALFAP